jgi:CheY-like chemotaxis protein
VDGVIGRETILVAEDEHMLREVVVQSLRVRGFTVLEAGSGAEAFSLAQEYAGTIHLLVTDIVMPGMGGRDLAALLADTLPDLRVLFMSGYTDDKKAHQEIAAKGVPLIEKPFTGQALARHVRAALAGPPYATRIV